MTSWQNTNKSKFTPKNINPFIVCMSNKKALRLKIICHLFWKSIRFLTTQLLQFCTIRPSHLHSGSFLWIALLSLKCSFRRDEKWKVKILLLSFIKRQKAIVKRYFIMVLFDAFCVMKSFTVHTSKQNFSKQHWFLFHLFSCGL